jgi:hypothetical protein
MRQNKHMPFHIPTSPDPMAPKRNLTVLLFGIYFLASALLIAYTLNLGQDANYDLLNYHLYSAASLAWGTGFDNLVNEQQFLAPYLYSLFYFLHRHLSPQLCAIVLTLIQALNMVLVGALTWQISATITANFFWRMSAMGLCVLLAGTGPMFLTEMGTSFADSLTTIPTLLALLCWNRAITLTLAQQKASLIQATTTSASATTTAIPTRYLHKPALYYFITGLLLGIASGLKLTCAIYSISLIFTNLLICPWGYKLRSTCALAISSALGFVGIAGYWMAQLYSHFASPLFPFYNGLFASPFYSQTNYVDTRFLPQSFLQALTYPVEFALGSHPSSEVPFSDPRFLVVFVLALCWGFMTLWDIARAKTHAAGHLTGKHKRKITSIQIDGVQSFKALLLFSLGVYLIWILSFGIQRYLLGIELLCGLLILGILLLIGFSQRTSLLLLATLTVAIVAHSRPGDFGHTAWAKVTSKLELPAALEQDAGLYLLTYHPSAFLFALWPTDAHGIRSQFIDSALTKDRHNAMGQSVYQRFHASPAKVYALLPPPNELEAQPKLVSDLQKWFLDYDFTVSANCLPVTAWIGQRMIAYQACPLLSIDQNLNPNLNQNVNPIVRQTASPTRSTTTEVAK